MLFDSTLRRDLARSFGATLVVILTIVLTMMLIRTLGQAALGRVSPQDVVLLLGYTALGQLPTMLALSLFIAVVATLGRMYRDSEMAIWFASGVGLARFAKPVLRTAWPVLLVIGLLALFVWPWVNQRAVDLRTRFEGRSDLSRVAPGSFQTSSDGRRTFFIDRDSADSTTGRNVFILTNTEHTEAVTTARSGHIELRGDERMLVLDRGQRNEENSQSGERTVSRFQTYTVNSGEKVRDTSAQRPPKARHTWELLQQPTAPFQGELAWRLGLVLGATNLLLLGIGLSHANPRRASNWNLLFALLAFIVYYNAINLTQAWVSSGRLGLGTALLLVHGGALAIAIGLLWWRDHGIAGLRRAPTQRAGPRRGAGQRMRTVRRLFYTDIVSAVGFVAVAFLSLFFFIDFVDELGDLGKRGYSALHAALYSVLEMPGHLYELAPIAVLIGSIYALSRMAQASEYTILRTGGLGPARALSLLAGLGAAFAVFTFLIGDYVAPFSEHQASALRARFGGSGGSGAWLKDRQKTPEGERNVAVHVRSAGHGADLQGIRIFEFDVDGALQQRIAAERGVVDAQGRWQLDDVRVTRWATAPGTAVSNSSTGPAANTIGDRRLASLSWPSGLSPDVVAAAVLPLATMSTTELWRYIGHLSANEQAAQRYEIQFWRRALYPFACLVMVALALPFAYLHARNGGISLKIFGGIMIGIGFVLLNNLAGHLGLLRNWTPWVTAAMPSAFFLLLSLAAFAWLVRYR